MDIICPWTYIAKKRIDEAIRQFRSSSSTTTTANDDVTFTIKYLPYQLYPEMSTDGENKYEWTKYGNSTERMQKFVTLMSAYGSAVGIDFNGFEGTIAGTLDAHRLIQFAQEGHGPEVADKVVNYFITLTYSQHYVALYESYHTKSLHPSAPSTLLTAAQSASASGLADEMEFFVSPQIDPAVFLRETKALLREQLSNGVDGVPLVVVEGRKRDFTLLGGREVGEYLEVLQKVAGEK